jgi:hypothetical protein
VLTLARVMSHIAEQMKKVPAYTCVQETVRTARAPSAKKFERVDRLRLEVVLSGNRELYAWPGDSDFSDAAINELVRGGAINSGSFGLFTRHLFLSKTVSFEFKGETAIDGRAAFEYGFRVPQFLSGYTMLTPGAAGISGYEGRFRADRESHELVTLTVNAIDIPPGVPYAESQLSIRYRRVPDLEGMSLPAHAVLIAKDLAGREFRNETTFTNCREFRAQSTILVEDVSSQLLSGPVRTDSSERPVSQEKHEPAPVPAGKPLPAGLQVKIRTDSPIDFSTAAVGDRVRGVVTDNVVHEGSVLLPKGTPLDGRLVRFERERADAFLISIRFSGYEIQGRRYPFYARLDSAGRRKLRLVDVGGGGPYAVRPPSVAHVSEPLSDWERNNNSFYSSQSKLSRGFHMTWVTQAAP